MLCDELRDLSETVERLVTEERAREVAADAAMVSEAW
jgi:hypothetical protein